MLHLFNRVFLSVVHTVSNLAVALPDSYSEYSRTAVLLRVPCQCITLIVNYSCIKVEANGAHQREIEISGDFFS